MGLLLCHGARWFLTDLYLSDARSTISPSTSGKMLPYWHFCKRYEASNVIACADRSFMLQVAKLHEAAGLRMELKVSGLLRPLEHNLAAMQPYLVVLVGLLLVGVRADTLEQEFNKLVSGQASVDGHKGIESPDYKVLNTTSGLEIREYENGTLESSKPTDAISIRCTELPFIFYIDGLAFVNHGYKQTCRRLLHSP